MIDRKNARKKLFFDAMVLVDAYKTRALEVAGIYNNAKFLWALRKHSPDRDSIVFHPSQGLVSMTYYDGDEDAGLDILLDDLWEDDAAIYDRLVKEKEEKEAARKALKDKENGWWKAEQEETAIRLLESKGYAVTKKDAQ